MSTRKHETALQRLTRLDRTIAVQRGLVAELIAEPAAERQLPLDEGVEEYYSFVGRPRVLRGGSDATKKRYRAVFNKAVPFFRNMGVTAWNQVTAEHLQSYVAWLDGEGYAYRTEFLEATTIKQAIKHWVEKGLLPQKSLITMPLDRPQGSDTYCYQAKEIAAMVQLCRSTSGLSWLADVIIGLAHTGLRISELADLSWACVDFPTNRIILADESRRRTPGGRKPRTNKSRRTRSFPIHETLSTVLTSLRERGTAGPVFKAAKGGSLHAGNLRTILVEQVIAPLAAEFPSPEDEIGFKDGRLHSFRHFFCSWCAAEGVPEQAVRHWLGHRNSAMVQHYFTLHDEQAQQQMRKLGVIPGLDAT